METFASLLCDQLKQLVCGAVIRKPSCINVPTDHQLEPCVDLDWCTLNHELLSELQYAQVCAVIQRTGEGSMTKLDVHQLKNMRDAMTREIQSWLKYHAMKAALRSQFAAKDVMQMRWILRFKDSGQAKSRVIIGCHDPRIAGEVRIEALVLSR